MNFPKTPEISSFAKTLATLKRGEKGIVEFIDTHHPLVQRLMTLGLVEGTEIERGHTAIGGDPIEFHLHGLSVSVRAEQARCFAVSTSPTD